MKKAIVLLTIAFAFVYCNPSQQADQTKIDSGTSKTSATLSTDTTTNMPDTTGRP